MPPGDDTTMRQLRIAAMLCGALTMGACDAEALPANDLDMGHLRMGVSGSNAAGTVFRLRDATFDIFAPGGIIASLSSEDSATTLDVLSQPLPVGDYDVGLREGWRLEEWDEASDVTTEVEASLLPSNPVAVSIVADATTSAIFTFLVGGQPLALGQGLEIDIDIGTSCDPLDPDACATGGTCAPTPSGNTCVESTGTAAELESCTWAGCEPGLICAPADDHPACDVDDCCVSYCDVLTAGSCDDAASGDTCVGLEFSANLNVGVCITPPA